MLCWIDFGVLPTGQSHKINSIFLTDQIINHFEQYYNHIVKPLSFCQRPPQKRFSKKGKKFENFTKHFWYFPSLFFIKKLNGKWILISPLVVLSSIQQNIIRKKNKTWKSAVLHTNAGAATPSNPSLEPTEHTLKNIQVYNRVQRYDVFLENYNGSEVYWCEM